MTYGLLTRRTDGTSILTPSTFTVRVVDVFFVSLPQVVVAQRASGATPIHRVARAKVRPGMFGTCTPSKAYTPIDPKKNNAGMAMAQLGNQAAQLPKITCESGQVALSVPITNGKFGGDFYVHIYEYL